MNVLCPTCNQQIPITRLVLFVLSEAADPLTMQQIRGKLDDATGYEFTGLQVKRAIQALRDAGHTIRLVWEKESKGAYQLERVSA